MNQPSVCIIQAKPWDEKDGYRVKCYCFVHDSVFWTYSVMPLPKTCPVLKEPEPEPTPVVL